MSIVTTRSARNQRIVTIVGTIIILLYSLGPFLWLFVASITPELKADFSRPNINNRQINYFPSQPTIENYYELFRNMPFALYMRNSTIIATGNMLLTLVVASLGAYGFVRFRFAGRSSFLVAMLVAYTIPRRRPARSIP